MEGGAAMQVMILEDDPTFRAELRALLAWEGLEVLCCGDVEEAKEVARDAILDLLVLGERVGGRLAHDVALLAEWRNPELGTVLLSDRAGEAREELSELLPSLRAVLPARAAAAAVARATLKAARTLGPEAWRPGARPEEDEPRAPPREVAPAPSPRAPAPEPARPAPCPVPRRLNSVVRRLHLA
jgi:hypothetical protein